ncbi:MFS transporter [Brevibacillus sp. SYSU BS000544]|uniref:MFS transporter n=1 Tax=Brevibacillus sp. SYSU BS000544 TaxID=3416443 RepID=UPI003CE512D9
MDSKVDYVTMRISDREYKTTEQKNMMLFLFGRFVSLFGTSVYNFAISFYVLKVTGSGLSFAISLALGTIPSIICGPVSAVLTDRVNRKKMIVFMDGISGMMVLGLLATATVDQLSIPYIYITTVLLSICHTFFDTPMGASIPNLVSRDSLPKINSWNEAVTSITNMAGPFLGGLIFAFVDIKAFLLINAVSFFISGISMMGIDFNLNKRNEANEEAAQNMTLSASDRGFVAELRSGIRYIVNEKWMKALLSFFVFLNFFMTFGMAVPIPYIVNEVLRLSTVQFGIIEAMFPFGVLVGSIIFSVSKGNISNFRKMIQSFVVIDIGVLLLGIVTCTSLFTLGNAAYFAIIAFLFFIVSAAVPFIMIPVNIMLQSRVPDEMRGKVLGLLGTIATLLIPLASILSGTLLDSIPAYMLPVFSALILFVLTFFMYRSEELRKI